MAPKKGQPAPSSATSKVSETLPVAAPRKGPHGLPIVTTIKPALVCMTSERLLSASVEISHSNQMWRQEYPDCAILPRGTELEYNWEGMGFSSGLNGYRGVTLTAPRPFELDEGLPVQAGARPRTKPLELPRRRILFPEQPSFLSIAFRGIWIDAIGVPSGRQLSCRARSSRQTPSCHARNAFPECN
jgi:hypothetical protein